MSRLMRNWVLLRTGWRHVLASRSAVASIVAAVTETAGAVSRAINSLVAPPSLPTHLLVVVACLPVVKFCAAAAWKCLKRAGLVSPMATPVRVGSSQVAAAAEGDRLVFPTKAGGSEERSFINGLSRVGKKQDQLKDMCRDYGLAVSGNKSQLKLRLQQYSERFCNDPASCNLTPVIRRTHKGPRNGEKKSQPKQSTNRRAAIIDTERITERSKDTRTADDVKDLLTWADRTLARLAYKPPKPETLPTTPSVVQSSSQPDRSLHDRMQAIENHLAVIATSGITHAAAAQWPQATLTPLTGYPIPPVDYTVYDPNYAQDFSFETTGNPFFDVSSHIAQPHAHNLHVGNPTWNYESSTISAPSATLPQPVNSTTIPASCSPSTDTTSPSKVPTRSVRLGSSTVIDIAVDAIKQIAVPATSFAENIVRLNQMWDDTSAYWKNDSVLVIDDHPTALIYWPEIFKKAGLWVAHKSNWTEWKFLVEHYRQGTPDEFWSTFRRKDGGKMSYTAICAAIRSERKTADRDLAAQARREYGVDFDSQFSYRCSKTNTRVVMTKDSSIAKEYKRLQGL
ncbi:hypothetical protein DFH06DRAFT_1483471 [Mycena polygramma]|nr:hypothetical protein DFH06DRAFT_1483471 [Mycena polygramma]